MFALEKIFIFLVKLVLLLNQLRNRSDGNELFEDGVLMVLPEHFEDTFDGKKMLRLEFGPVLIDQLDKALNII